MSKAEGEQLRAAYQHCQTTARTHAKSFYFSARFLPVEKRQAIYAVYALCRQVDDAVDKLHNPTEQEGRAAVARWQKQLEAVYQIAGADAEAVKTPSEIDSANGVEECAAPVFIAWRDMLKTYAIPLDLPLELMRGVVMDTHITRYQTWAELKVYCYRVASVVGLMVTEIFGYTGGQQTLRYAATLGYAMQLTNILRDVREDAGLGRIYVPQEDLHRFRVSEQDILDGRKTHEFARLMQFEITRARALYAEAEQGIKFLDGDARFTVLLAARLYARILDEIEKAGYDVFSVRAHTSLTQKVRAVPQVWRDARRL